EPITAHRLFAHPPLARLDELHDGDPPVASDGAHDDAEGGRRLALAIAGVDDHQAARATALRVLVVGGDLGRIGRIAQPRTSRSGRTTGCPPSWMIRTLAP